MLPFALLGACLVAGVLPALAADRGVGIRDFSFTPGKVAVMPGETVTWTAEPGYSSSMHNVHFDDQAGALGPQSTSFTASRTFDHEGTYTYHCDVHPLQMRGTVYVNATGTVPTPSPTPSPTASPTPSGEPSTSPSPSSGGGGSGGGQIGPAASVPVFRVHVASRGHRVLLTLTVAESVRVKGTLRRGKRRVRRVSLLARAGRHTRRLPGKRLKPGRYTLTLKAGDITRVVRFRVRR
jgi:plastocyanin